MNVGMDQRSARRTVLVLSPVTVSVDSLLLRHRFPGISNLRLSGLNIVHHGIYLLSGLVVSAVYNHQAGAAMSPVLSASCVDLYRVPKMAARDQDHLCFHCHLALHSPVSIF
jgi:hypothetical protein